MLKRFSLRLPPKRYLILAFLAVVAGILFAVFTKKQSNPPPVNVTPTPSQTILEIINTAPANNGKVIASTINAVTLTFDQSIDPSTAEIEILPNVEITPISHSNRPSTLILSPTTPWQAGVNYTLTLKNLSSLDEKSRVASPIIITFIAIEAPPPIYNEPI